MAVDETVTTDPDNRPATRSWWRHAILARTMRAGMLAGTLFLAGCPSFSPLDTAIDPTPIAVNAAPPQNQSDDPEHNRIVATYGGVYTDPNAATAVARAVGRLVSASDDPSQSYRITLLNSPVVNAFALPSGNLYVTRGLLVLANDTSEVAAVIAHEMAHVTARHAVARQRRAEAAQELNKAVAGALQDSDQQRLALASTQVSLARFSQIQELEADAIGVKTLGRAGFDPFAASRFLSSMARYADYRSLKPNASSNRPDFLASHPSTPERIGFAIRAAREIGAPGIGEQEREAYLQELDGMVFGDDPSEGFVRGRSFLHKALGIEFSVPSGYNLENTPKAVLASDASGTAMRFDGVAVDPATALPDYLRSGWINGLDPASITTATVGDFSAATAHAAADGWTFRIGVVRSGRTVYRFIFAAQEPQPSFDAAFTETLDSFHHLSPSESARLRPLHIKVHRVRPGDTVERMADMMSGVDRKLDLFRVLNGLDQGDQVDVGKLVKLVTDQ
ncbi:MAG: M48 family metalloprotease [Ancalomicrobiaceae bacterium]|nr:M48 family metalloprotease [Ancalomicrobiaceae bacterium]